MAELWVVGDRLRSVDRGDRHVGLVGEGQPLGASPRTEDVAQFGLELGVVAGVVGVGRARPLLEQVHAVDAPAEVLPEGLFGGHEQHVAVVHRIDLVADALPHAGQPGSATLVVVGGIARDHVVGPLVGPVGLDAVPVHVGGCIGLRHLDGHALAGLAGTDHGRQDAEGSDHRTHVDADVRQRRDPGEALLVDHRLDQARPRVIGDAVARHVPVGAGCPVAGDGAEDESRVDGPQVVDAEPELRQRSGPHGLYDDVGAADQVLVDLDPLVGLEVDGDAALAPVGVQVQQRRPLHDRPGHLPDVVATGRLDLDDVGAQVGEERGHEPGPQKGTLDHAQALQRAALSHGGILPPPSPFVQPPAGAATRPP